MRISDWSSDVCSSDLVPLAVSPHPFRQAGRSMIAAALTSPCLIRSDGRTITIEPLRVVPFSHDVGVAGIPLRHANLSGTDQRSGSREAPVSLPRRSAGGDQIGRAHV